MFSHSRQKDEQQQLQVFYHDNSKRLKQTEFPFSVSTAAEKKMEADSTEDIEFLMEDMDYIPGHFHLDLNLNCDPAGPVRLRLRDTYLKQESLRGELEAEVGYLQYAVRNLLGLLAFHMEQLDTAEEILR